MKKFQENRKKITILFEDTLIKKIEYAMNVLKIRNYNSILYTALIKGYSIDQIFEYAKEKESEKADSSNLKNERIEMYN